MAIQPERHRQIEKQIKQFVNEANKKYNTDPPQVVAAAVLSRSVLVAAETILQAIDTHSKFLDVSLKKYTGFI